MGRAQTTQATGKAWKLLKVVGVFAILFGIAFLILAVGMAEPGRRSPASQSAIPYVLIVLGLPAYCFGRVGAWWFHG